MFHFVHRCGVLQRKRTGRRCRLPEGGETQCGVLAVNLRQQNLAQQLNAAQGALMGMLAGLIGGIIGAVLSIPIQMMMGPMQAEWMSRILENNNEVPAETREMLERLMTGSSMRAVGAIMNVVVSVIFGMLGGLLGVAIFKRNAPPAPPPMPPTVIPHDPGTAL